MVHQCRHGNTRCFAIIKIIKIKHIIPVVESFIKIYSKFAYMSPCIRMFAHSTMRPFPVFHNLSHCCRHTTRNSLFFIYHRAHRIKRETLTPLCFNEWFNSGAIFCRRLLSFREALPLSLHRFGSDNLIINKTLDSFINILKPFIYIDRHIFHRKRILVGICDNRRSPVVSGDDNEAVVAAEDIEVVEISLRT